MSSPHGAGPGEPEASGCGSGGDATGGSGTEPEGKPQPVSLDLLPRELVRRRARAVALMAMALGAVTGSVVGLAAGWVAGPVAVVVVGGPLALLALGEARRRSWLAGTTVASRALGVRRVELRRASRVELLVSEVRGQRSVSLLMSESGSSTVTVPIALYSATGGIELGVLALRRLADALAAVTGSHPAALVLSALLVAQLRAEARSAPLAQRPLYLAAGLAPASRVVRRIDPGRLAAFVAELA